MREILRARLEELVDIHGSARKATSYLGLNETTVSRFLDDGSGRTDEITLKVIEQCYANGIIPVVITREGKIEDLNNPRFYQGINIGNYCGRVVRKHRNKKNSRGWSQRKLAEEADIQQTMVSNLELGNGSNVSTLEKALAALGLDVHYFIEPNQLSTFGHGSSLRVGRIKTRLQLRLDELYDELGDRNKVADYLGIDPRTLDTTRERGYLGLHILGKSYDKGIIPVVFVMQDGTVEDFDNPLFLCGDQITNYIGRVIRKHRYAAEIIRHEAIDTAGVSRGKITRLEGQSAGYSDALETMAALLGLKVHYFVDPKTHNLQGVVKRRYREMMSLVEQCESSGLPISPGLIKGLQQGAEALRYARERLEI